MKYDLQRFQNYWIKQKGLKAEKMILMHRSDDAIDAEHYLILKKYGVEWKTRDFEPL